MNERITWAAQMQIHQAAIARYLVARAKCRRRGCMEGRAHGLARRNIGERARRFHGLIRPRIDRRHHRPRSGARLPRGVRRELVRRRVVPMTFYV